MNYIIDFKPVMMEDLNFDYIKEIEEKIKSKGLISNDEIIYFLDSLCYKARFKINEKLDNFDYKCDLFQSVLYHYLKRIDCVVIPCMTHNVITKDIVGHSFLVAKFFVNGEDQYFLLDPSYIQFFNKERCQISNFIINTQSPYQILLTPDPGFFIKEDKMEMAKFLCNRGYIALNNDTAQMYGDSFLNTKVGELNRNYKSIPGSIYFKSFLKGKETLSKSEEELAELGFLDLFGDNIISKK